MFTIEKQADRFAALQCLEPIATDQTWRQRFTAPPERADPTRPCIRKRIAMQVIDAAQHGILRASLQSWNGATLSHGMEQHSRRGIARRDTLNFSDILDKPAELPLQCSK
jgi:hypothetical protein